MENVETRATSWESAAKVTVRQVRREDETARILTPAAERRRGGEERRGEERRGRESRGHRGQRYWKYEGNRGRDEDR